MYVGVHGASTSGDAGFHEVAERYETWRDRWVSAVGKDPSRNVPELLDGSLWFRNGYPYPDWTAEVIRPSQFGYLVLSATTERRSSPYIAVEAVFSRLEDAGKHVLTLIGDMLRLECKLEPVYRQWQRSGISAALQKSVADQQVVEFIATYNGVSRDVVERVMHKYSVRAMPSSYAHLSSSDEPTSRVLTMSYDELDATLADGLNVTG